MYPLPRASFEEKLRAVAQHGLVWEKGNPDIWSLKEAMEHRTKVPRMACLKDLLAILGVVDRMPRGKIGCMQELVPHLLWVDLQPYRRNRNGIDKLCLPHETLRQAVQAWIHAHPR